MPKRVSNQPDILKRAAALQPKLTQWRRTIHSHPELSFQESSTCMMVAETLGGLGYDVRPGIGGTGVLAEIGEGRTVIIRADMDALPIEESTQQPYASHTLGVMHACGHDAHTACALGAAALIAETSPENGCVRFLFQPAEEAVNEEGRSGASLLIDQGATDGAEAIFALHVDPRLPAGKIALRDGALLSACDSFDICIKGKGSHGAYPETGIDAVVLASHVVQAIQQIVSRRKSALLPAVVTIGGIRSNTYRSNIIAEEVELTGTVRYLDATIHDLVLTELERACHMAEALGGSHGLRYKQDSPTLLNDLQLANLVRVVGKKILGAENVSEAGQEMGGDDFAFYTHHLPGCYFLLGAMIEGSPRMLHTPDFDIDESALPVGAAMLAECAARYLNP